MPVSTNIQHTPPDQIRVGPRQRSETKTDNLLNSIRLWGILNPILVRAETGNSITLVAGHRRLACAIELNFETVPVLFYDALDSIDAHAIELEENIKREDLPWRDHVRAIGDFDRLKHDADSTWTSAKTAELLSYSAAHLSRIKTVYTALETSAIAEASSIEHAYGILQRISERRTASIVETLLRAPSTLREAMLPATPPELAPVTPGLGLAGRRPASAPSTAAISVLHPEIGSVLHATDVSTIPPAAPRSPVIVADFLTWAPNYAGPKFNLIHCDFPYGNNAADATLEHYENNPRLFWDLTDALTNNLDKLLSYSAHVMFWLSFENYEQTKMALSRAGLRVVNRPLIWVRSDSKGAAPGVKGTLPRHSYEICLLAHRGNRPLTRQNCDSYSAPTVTNPIHPTQKPESMLEYFLAMLTDSVTDFLDPTCGSAASLRAAERCGARTVLGLEINPDYAAAANAATQVARRKHEANDFITRALI